MSFVRQVEQLHIYGWIVHTFDRTFAHVTEIKINLVGFKENLGLTCALVAVVGDNFCRVLRAGIIKSRSTFYAKRYGSTNNLG